MKENYDKKKFEMDIQDFETFKNLNQEELDQKFIEGASYIIQKKIKGKK